LMEANMLTLISRLYAKRAQKRRERDYGDLRGPLADALESELARLDALTHALVVDHKSQRRSGSARAA